jgi:hypothetical protein
MSNWKDKVKTLGRKSAPKIEIASRVSVKMHDGKPMFVKYDKENKTNEYSDTPIEGVLLGNCMIMEAFSDTLGRNGGTYRSDYFFKKDRVTMYGNGEKVFAGTADEVDAWVAKNTSEKGAKKRMVMFVLTKNGIVAITTNMTLGIDSINGVGEKSQSNFVMVIPKLFSNSDKSVGRKAKEVLGKLAAKNPPSYASLSVGDEITDGFANATNLGDVIDQFVEWRNYKLSATKQSEPDQEEPTPTVVEDTNDLPF